MRKIFFLLLLICLPSLCCCWSYPDTCERLASEQTIINAQRADAEALIINSNLSDSVKNKPYCIFYISGCRGIGGWVIVVDNGQDYRAYYTDSFISAQEYLYKTVTHSKDNEEMQLLFSQKSLKGTKMKLDDSVVHFTYYYFGLFDTKGSLSLDWNQSLCFYDVQAQQRITRVCMKFILPFIV